MPQKDFCNTICHKQTSAPSRSPNAIPVRDYERVVDDVKYIRATIERFEGGRWRSRTTCRSGGEAPARPAGAATPANHSTEIYWFARSAAAAVAMYFE
jgi:hypothetical protein